ncbi:hypothetical protein ACHAXA_000176 [Cyclostephanos tholiformis]|uniref:Uncharacterized protein n=1 Tax=Cyclostephanos tholiformis TaxID=382380 RepID=A0ABD3R6Q6_9STRA
MQGSATISPTNGLGSAQEVESDELAPSQKGRASFGLNAPTVLSRSSSVGMPPEAGSHQNAKSIGICIQPAPGAARIQAQACSSFLPSHAEEIRGYHQVPAFIHNKQDELVFGGRFDSYAFPSLKFPSLLDSGIGNLSTSSTHSAPSPRTTNLLSLNESPSYLNSNSRHEGAAVHNYDNGTPDLLLGFDKHAAFMKKDNVEDMTDSFTARPIPEDSHLFAGAGCIGESPYITSRSFDELHRHLGIGLSSEKVSHLDLNHLGSHANFIFPIPSATSKEGRLPPVVDALANFAQS